MSPAAPRSNPKHTIYTFTWFHLFDCYYSICLLYLSSDSANEHKFQIKGIIFGQNWPKFLFFQKVLYFFASPSRHVVQRRDVFLILFLRTFITWQHSLTHDTRERQWKVLCKIKILYFVSKYFWTGQSLANFYSSSC